MTGSQLRISWPTAPGRLYRLLGTRDFQQWIPLSPWMQTNAITGSISVAVPGPDEPNFFRLEAQP